MKLIKVASAVLNQTPLAWEQNKRNILDAIATARDQGATILCLPELCISAYGCEDAFHSRGLQATALRVLNEIVPATDGMVVALGLPLLFQNALFNTVSLVADRQILGFVAKQHLPGEGLHYEPRWFKAWPKGQHAEITVDGRRYPLGDIHFDCGGVKIGFEICEDAWVANRTGSGLSLEGVDIILSPSASHFAFGKREVRKRLVLEGSRAFGVTYIYASPLGNEAGRVIYEGGAMIATAGKLVAQGPRFSFADYGVTCAVVDIDATRMAQARSTSFTPEVDGDDSGLVRVDFEFPELDPTDDSSVTVSSAADIDSKEQEFTRAVALALFDYLRKSRSNGFVVSLSGGADSAACACLVSLLVELGVAELGLEGFLAKLSYIQEIQSCKTPSEIIPRILLCVYQSTANSSQTTRDAARQVAEEIGAQFVEFDVDGLVTQYVTMVSRAVGRELIWDADDVALQNIQARARAPGVWMLANLRKSLLLSTSNRSEAAVGYATMDGDTCGGLSPIAGIDKAFLRKWLRWLEDEGPNGLHPIPALSAVNRQQPTAELRPLEAGQTDEDDLMPYDVLDTVERAAIRDKLAPIEVFRRICPQFEQYDGGQLGAWVERFFTLWSRNQWKRERYAPSFHVDDENLDPKTWCRFPILSGGFERELRELRDHLAGG
jgi:NAD+ synthase (glutamine-hydrolysing)